MQFGAISNIDLSDYENKQVDLLSSNLKDKQVGIN